RVAVRGGVDDEDAGWHDGAPPVGAANGLGGGTPGVDQPVVERVADQFGT
ncbi:MAG: hypothetical protein JWQ48_2812, partial [Conexibacter sp.]|nr:hypothetical protein [Conexibacter sp.]